MVVGVLLGCDRPHPTTQPATQAQAAKPLRLVVMDPLALPLSCECVEGYAQRRYDKLGVFLEQRLNRPVMIAFAEALQTPLDQSPGDLHVIIGKESVVEFDAAALNIPVTPIARLTDKSGATDQTGMFVVRGDDPAKTIQDLKGYRILFGPKEDAEKHQAALAAMRKNNIPLPATIQTSPGCASAALAVIEKKAGAAVISGYAKPLLEGCDTIAKGEIRVVAQTGPVPFITAFVTDAVSQDERKRILDALLAVAEDKKLLTAMESSRGFVPIKQKGGASAENPGWPDWRGPGRHAISSDVPAKLPAKANFLWTRKLTGLGLSGVTATSKYVLVSDKNREDTEDIWRCLDADTGRELWHLKYPAAEEPAADKMDFSNSPRAAPVIHHGRAYLLGAFGHLHCVRLPTGRVLWKKNIIKEFGAKLPAWGMTATPLIIGQKLIVNPGAPGAGVVALDRCTGKVIWKGPGKQAAYAAFIVAEFGGVRQIVGYDSISLGGWDPATGKRLWQLVPPEEGDFNVPTPIAVDGKLLVATENNGTRLYGFDARGVIIPKPLAHTEDLIPDTVTPVIYEGMAFGNHVDEGKLICLDVGNGLKTLWKAKDDVYGDYICMIAGNGRILILTVEGELLLLKADRKKYTLISRLRVFQNPKTEIWAHPALVRGRLYIRNQDSVACLLLN